MRRTQTHFCYRWLLVLLAGICLAGSPASGQLREINQLNRDMYRAQRYGNTQRQQQVTALQSQLQTLRQQLTSAESDVEAVRAEISPIEEQLKQQQSTLDEHEKTVREAMKALKEIEGKVLERQPARSEYGEANARAETQQHELETAIREILHLPPDTEPQTSSLQLRLSPKQQAQLKGDSRYEQAISAVKTANERVQQISRQICSDDPAWQKASTALKSAQAAVQSAKKDSQSSAAQAGKLRKQQIAATKLAEQTRQKVAWTESQLQALGANPQRNANTNPAPTPEAMN